MEKLGAVEFRTGSETLGARALSVHPSSGEIAFTVGGTLQDVWLMRRADGPLER